MLFERLSVSGRLAGPGAWLAAALLLVSPAAFAQQQSGTPNQPAPPPKQSPPLKLETADVTNDRIAQLAVAALAKQGDSVVGAGDLLQIDVFDIPELSREVRVNQSGNIRMPLVPVRIRAAGLTAVQLQDKLTELLQANGLVSHPNVTVYIKEQRSQPITVIGAVKTPMVYQAVRPTTLLEVLSQAGGIADDAGNIVMVTRANPPGVAGDPEGADSPSPGTPATSPQPVTISIHLTDLLDSGDPKFNIPLLGGDVVSVPRAGVVYVVGAVDHPGGFVMASDREEMTTLKALSLAGGLKGSAKPRQAVILRREPSTGQRQEVPVDLTKILSLKAEDVALHPSDILFVPDSLSKRAWRRTGEIAIALSTGVALFRLGR